MPPRWRRGSAARWSSTSASPPPRCASTSHEVDIATARAESYPHPGALPEVEPTAGIAADLARRDFTINAMAIPLRRDPELIDPHGGKQDLEAGLLRILHPRSFEDDPTRALRAARYAARFGFELEPDTAELLSQTDLSTVSVDRRDAELLRLAGEDRGGAGLRPARRVGAARAERRRGGAGRPRRGAARGGALGGGRPPRPGGPRRGAGTVGAGPEELAAAHPERPSEAVRLARGADPVELVIARAMGAEWLDRYLTRVAAGRPSRSTATI